MEKKTCFMPLAMPFQFSQGGSSKLTVRHRNHLSSDGEQVAATSIRRGNHRRPILTEWLLYVVDFMVGTAGFEPTTSTV